MNRRIKYEDLGYYKCYSNVLYDILDKKFIEFGIVGILKLAKIKGLIPEIKPFLDKLIDNNFRISLKLYNEILRETNEL